MSKESQSGGELLAATGVAIFRAASNAAVALTPCSTAKVGFFAFVCALAGFCGFPICCSAFCSHACYSSSAYLQSYSRGRRMIFSINATKKQLGAAYGWAFPARDVLERSAHLTPPAPCAVDVSGLFHQTVTNCRGREGVCGLWPLPFHFFSSCAVIASPPPTRPNPPTSIQGHLERWKGDPRVAATFSIDISLSPPFHV